MMQEVPPQEITPEVQTCCCDQNRELVTLVGNLYHEAEEHARGLASLYELLQTLPYAIPRAWAHKLHDEYARHHVATGRNVDSLRALVAK